MRAGGRLGSAVSVPCLTGPAMALSPEKASELKQIIHQQLTQVSNKGGGRAGRQVYSQDAPTTVSGAYS